jgi:phosphoribosylformimino-5-aminoimidazole carboxamide ribotide isomerase
MIAIPAIDLLDGRCVRLREGVFETATVYGESPADVAARFAAEGASRIHVVDLDAARGKGNNREVIGEIRRVYDGILDVGGGIRSIEDARALRLLGADLLVAGTVLVRNPEALSAWISELGPVFVGGIDAREGEVKVSGWESGSAIKTREAAERARDLGVVEIIYTDISRDGTFKGPNIAETEAVAAVSGLPVVISGGVGSMDHLRSLAETPPPGITGIIFGRALYEGLVNLREAIAILGGTS